MLRGLSGPRFFESKNMNYLRSIRLKDQPEAWDTWSYLNSMPLVKYLANTEGLAFHKPVTFFVGENGTGKSTLLEAIAVAMGFNAEGGSRDFQFSTKATHSELSRHLVLNKSGVPADGFFLRAESFYNTASYLDENSSLKRYGGTSLHNLSHGESFLALIQNRFEGKGLYLLDEPEAAVSPRRLLSLLVLIDNLTKANSQLIIVTHSPILLAYPDAEILEFSESGIASVGYEDTDSYRITKEFLDDPQRMVHYLLDSE